jgi:photosystem II stability/assembly factor-like uncharacterized protein
MRATLLSLLTIFALAVPQNPNSQILTSGIDTSLRGLSVSQANDTHILWATGSSGAILRSPNAGKSWTRLHIEYAHTQDFRGVRAFGIDTAYVFSVGNENKSHIYKTTDAGKTWRMQYSDPRPSFFLDGLVCRDEKRCFAISDPIDGKFPILHTEDGEHWTELPQSAEPVALPNEGVFAASNSSLILCGANNSDILFAAGGPAARVFHSADNARTWTVAKTPILSGNASSGIFSIACDGRTVAAVGGDYRNPTATKSVAAYSTDFGATWHLSDRPPAGFRSAVVALPSKPSTIWLAVGTTGADISTDNAANWSPFGHDNANAAIAIGDNRLLTAGPKGTIGQAVVRPDALQP